MNEPLIVAALVSMIGLVIAAIITGLFKNSPAANSNKITNGLLNALQAQTKSLSDLTEVLRDSQKEERQAHQKMIEGITTLLERVKRNPK